jgi:hypothetical protein
LREPVAVERYALFHGREERAQAVELERAKRLGRQRLELRLEDHAGSVVAAAAPLKSGRQS